MAMTPAERQARYRERVKMRGPETPEAAVERVRQEIYAEIFAEARTEVAYRDAEDVERNVTFLRAVAARPMWPEGGFADWLAGVVVTAVEDEIGRARRDERGGRRKRRTVT